VVCNSASEDSADVYLYRLGCVAARRARGRPVGGAVEGGIVDVTLVGGAVEGGVDVVWTAGGVLVGGAVGGAVEGGVGALVGGAVEGSVVVLDAVCTAGGAVAGGTRGGDPGLCMVREVHKQGRGQRRTWFCAVLTL
jgi:hypothetical protein